MNNQAKYFNPGELSAVVWFETHGAEACVLSVDRMGDAWATGAYSVVYALHPNGPFQAMVPAVANITSAAPGTARIECGWCPYVGIKVATVESTGFTHCARAAFFGGG